MVRESLPVPLLNSPFLPGTLFTSDHGAICRDLVEEGIRWVV